MIIVVVLVVVVLPSEETGFVVSPEARSPSVVLSSPFVIISLVPVCVAGSPAGENTDLFNRDWYKVKQCTLVR